MKKLKTIIVEDNPLARQALKSELTKLEVVELAGEAEGVFSGLKLIRRENPDLIFLDIELEDGSGFEILDLAGDLKAKVIFITASEKFAIKAFRVAALDYLLKPVDPKLLVVAVEKAITLLGTEFRQYQLLQKIVKNESPEEIVLHTQDKILVVKLKNIIRCKAIGNYTQFHFEDGTNLLVAKTLKYFAEILEPQNFIRTHQSHLVNRQWIKEYVKKEGGYLLLREGSSVPVSYRKRSMVISALQK